ncbi:MAG: hypothetical protein IJH36_13350 [Clostridia bacterium]|nr:hypothetical protein [Clostridia bacterium]MBQ3464062.1 hypothetical protein [Clostridia bacterium]
MAKYCTIRITMPEQMADKVTKTLSKNGLTLEQAINAFLLWCVNNPDLMKNWYEENKHLLEEDDGLAVEILE